MGREIQILHYQEGQGEKLGESELQQDDTGMQVITCDVFLSIGVPRIQSIQRKTRKIPETQGKMVTLLGTSEISLKDTLSNFKSVFRVHCSQSSTNLALLGYQLVRTKCSRGQG